MTTADTARLKRTPLRSGARLTASSSLRWWNSLHFRLAVAINLLAIGVLGSFWLLDYRHQRTAYVGVEIARLREEAKVLRAAQTQLSEPHDFQTFLDAFCRQMGVTASPGHHIAIFGPKGDVVARAHERASAALEEKMAAGNAVANTFTLDGEAYLAVSVPGPRGRRIAVAQALAPIEEIVRAQAISRAVSLAILALLVFGATAILVLRWVRDPLRALVTCIRGLGHRRFDVRVRPSGSPELRYLADGVNEMARALESAEKDRAAQMRRAREIQARLLPRNGAMHGPYEITACFRPADSVAGDLYDIIELANGSLLLAVLDVCGHGVAAALYTALLRTVLRAQAKLTPRLDRIVQAMNRELAGVVGHSGEFATCFLLRLDPNTGTLEYVGAGHDPAIAIGAAGSPRLFEGTGLPLGIRADEPYPVTTAALRPDERLFLYTDGLHEVFNASGVRFGRQRLIELLSRTVAREPAGQLNDVIRDVESFVDNRSFDDDVTLVCVCRKSPAAATELN